MKRGRKPKINHFVDPALAELSNTPQLSVMKNRFVEEYLKDLNGAAAARRAGYSKNNSAQKAYALMQEPDIRNEIKRRGDLDAADLDLSRAYVLTTLNRVLQKAIEGNQKTTGVDGKIVKDDEGRPIYEWEPTAAVQALKLLAQLRGDLIERLETRSVTVEMVLNDVNVEDLT